LLLVGMPGPRGGVTGEATFCLYSNSENTLPAGLRFLFADIDPRTQLGLTTDGSAKAVCSVFGVGEAG